MRSEPAWYAECRHLYSTNVGAGRRWTFVALAAYFGKTTAAVARALRNDKRMRDVLKSRKRWQHLVKIKLLEQAMDQIYKEEEEHKCL